MSSTVRSSSAKRSASGNLSNSSDDEQEDQLHDLEPNNTSLSSSIVTASDLDTTSSLDCSDNPCSPGASSSCSGSSGPIYIRPPGFKYHAQEVTRPRQKKKKKTFPINQTQTVVLSRQQTELYKKRDATPPKHRQIKRDPVPMRLRAFPQSFWKEPNQPVGVAPGHCLKVLPPLAIKDEIDMVRPVTPPDENRPTDSYLASKDKSLSVVTNNSNSSSKVTSRPADRKVVVTGNPETALSKLFDNVEERVTLKRTDGGNYKVPVPPSTGLKKSRPKNAYTLNKSMMHGSDPYMVDKVADKLFPHLTLEKAAAKSTHTSGGGGTTIQLITLKEGDKSVTLPSLCVEQNYSQMLSELIPHL
ncbi:uncharacterized protein [Watersipora subatra]|uniref:uncharacterized protein n=1 Tax=Watersipora subatra TaxID=2589382 RepID=UPI00355AEF0B